MKKFLVPLILLSIIAYVSITQAQQVSRMSGALMSTGAQSPINIFSSTPSAIRYHRIYWYTQGGPSGCTAKLEGSADSVSWADLIPAQTCTSTGGTVTSVANTTGTINYVRVNLTALSGGTSPSVRVYYAGWVLNPDSASNASTVAIDQSTPGTTNGVTIVGSGGGTATVTGGKLDVNATVTPSANATVDVNKIGGAALGSVTAGFLPVVIGTTSGTGVIGHVVADTGSTTAVTQATASNLKAQVTGTGSAGTADTGVVTVQGIASGTPVIVSASSPNLFGVMYTAPCPPASQVYGSATFTTATSGALTFTMAGGGTFTAPTGTDRLYIWSAQTVNTGSTNVGITWRNGAAGGVLGYASAPSTFGGSNAVYGVPIRPSAATALYAQTDGSSTTVQVSAQGCLGP